MQPARWRVVAKRFSMAIAGACALFGAASAPTLAQAPTAADIAAWPDKPVRLIVSAAAGGGNDFIARILAEKLPAMWGQSVIVENRPGAGNNLAATVVYRAPPDGYTLLVSPPAPLVVNAALFRDLKFEPDKLEPVAITSFIPNVLVVNANSRFRTAQDFFAFAKANPGKLNYASQGNGTTGHLTAALMESVLGARHAHVPYNGAGPAMNDLAAGHVDFMFADIGTVLPLAQGGKVRILASLTREKIAAAPDLPLIADIGYPQLLSDTWTAVTAPPGTPLVIRERMAKDMRTVMFMPDVRARLEAIGVTPWGKGPAEMTQIVREETARWTQVVRDAKVRID